MSVHTGSDAAAPGKLVKAENRARNNLFAAISYRIPLPVTQVLVFRDNTGYPICPRCDVTVDREYMRFCDRCGQRLGWELFDFAKVVYAPRVPK